MDIGDAFRARINDRVGEVIGKYFDRGFSGQIVVVKSGSRYTADCMIRLDSGASLQATGEAQDPTLAFEAAADRFETRLRRYKRRLKSHNSGNANGEPTDVAYTVMASAVIELDAKDSPVLVFRNAGNEHLNIVYRRPDGNIGWIDPSTTKVAQG